METPPNDDYIKKVRFQAKKEVFDDLEKHPDWKRLGLQIHVEKLKEKHLVKVK